MQVHEVHYRDNVFRFELSREDIMEGRLLLDDTQRELLRRLMAAEDECWYLDADGYRLPPGPLFERSPWSCPGPAGPIKLLCRFLDLRDGQAMFSTRELYGDSGLYDWLLRGRS